MNYPTSILEYGGRKYFLTWIRDDDLSKYKPVGQVYGIVFNEKEEILIARPGPEDPWAIPGGTPEKGETIEQALQREFLEEVDVKVKNILPLGTQKVEAEDGSITHQLRCIALLDHLLPQTIDPDPTKNTVWERKFVPAENATEYVKWGKIGEAMFRDAIQLYKTLSGGGHS